MVKKIVRYECEFPGCGREYRLHKDAVKCESRGIIGPEIDPGLMLALPGQGYAIITSTRTDKGHEKQYKLIEIRGSLQTIIHNEEAAKSNEKHSSRHQTEFWWKNYYISTLENSFKRCCSRFLERNEFSKLSRLIYHGKSFNGVRMALENEGIEKLVRTHPYFSSLKKA